MPMVFPTRTASRMRRPALSAGFRLKAVLCSRPGNPRLISVEDPFDPNSVGRRLRYLLESRLTVLRKERP